MIEPESNTRRTSRSLAGRIVHAWRGLPPERRLAAVAALGLFVTLFLPWYQETVITTGVGTKFALPSASLTGWAAFSFVEAAVLVVAVSVLILLFVRAEGRAFHVPGGDGGVIFAAGLWTAVLILWRMFDKSSTTGHGQYVTTSGIEWGIFIALGIAALLAYAGSRIKLAREPEPPLPGERPDQGRARTAAAGGRSARQRGRPPRPVRAADPPRQDADRDAGWVTPDPSTGETVVGPASEPATRRLENQAGSEPETRRIEDPTAKRPRRTRPEGQPGKRGLNFSDLDEIEFDEPPEAPTVRQAPATRRLPGTD
ncbi:MAG: hypothetical protein ACRDNK_09245 [Solirubrobacteraceae bacterium]